MPQCISLLPNKVAIYQRANSGRWQARIKLKTGKWERYSTGTADEAEAREAALKLYYGSEAKAENRLPQSTRKFRNVAKYAITRMQNELDGGIGKVVYKHYISAINNYLIPFFGNKDIATVDAKSLHSYAAWRDQRMEVDLKARKLKALKNRANDPASFIAGKEEIQKIGFKAKQSTINTHNSALNRVFDEALLHGWITESIKPKLLNKGLKSNSRGAFTEDEYNEILWQILGWSRTGKTKKTLELREVLACYVIILANTGIRAGTEAYNLKWKNMHYIPSEHERPYLAINVDGKRGKRELIATDLATALLAQLAAINPRTKHFEELDELLEAKHDEYVFVDRSGNRVSTESLRQSFRQFLEHHNLKEGADGKNRTLYSLRHTYATIALTEGRDIHKLAVQMGTSVAMLEKFYSKLSARLNAAEHSGRSKEIERLLHK